MYTISKQFSFSASHQLTHLPDEHKCKRLHGHNFLVILELRSPVLNEYGFVVDYGDLKPFKDYIDNELDHRHLNDVLPVMPTSENLAEHLYNVAWKLWHDVAIIVKVSETVSTWASYEGV